MKKEGFVLSISGHQELEERRREGARERSRLPVQDRIEQDRTGHVPQCDVGIVGKMSE